jgi:hypothetical protein
MKNVQNQPKKYQFPAFPRREKRSMPAKKRRVNGDSGSVLPASYQPANEWPGFNDGFGNFKRIANALHRRIRIRLGAGMNSC